MKSVPLWRPKYSNVLSYYAGYLPCTVNSRVPVYLPVPEGYPGSTRKNPGVRRVPGYPISHPIGYPGSVLPVTAALATIVDVYAHQRLSFTDPLAHD